MFNWWIRRKLESSDPEKRKSALERLVKSGTFQPLMAVLKNPTLRDEAISEFSKLGRTAEDFLNAASSHQDIEVKSGAILAFGRMRNERAADLLAELIQTSSASKKDRWEAIQLLSKTSGGPGAVAALQAVLNNQNEDLRTEATLGLGRIGEAAAVEPLIDLLADRKANSKARSEAAILLGDLKDTRATDVLKSLLDEDSPVKDAAIRALGAMGILEPLIRLLSEQNEEAVAALGRPKLPLVVQPLIEALQNGDRKWQEQVIQALGRTEDARGLDAVHESLRIYNDTEWQLAVADALGRDNRAVEIILELIKEQMRLAYGYDRDWAAATKTRIATLVDLLGKIRNPLAHEFIGNLVDRERNDLEKLMNANDFIHHYESLKLLQSAVKALGEVGNTDDFATLNLVSRQLEGYRQAILNSQRDHALTDSRRFEEVGQVAQSAINRILTREPYVATKPVVDLTEPQPAPDAGGPIKERLSVVLFREGSDQPTQPERYYETIVAAKFGATTPIIKCWRILGLREHYSLADCAVLYKKMVVEGKLDYFGIQVDEWVGKGPDGRRVVALFYSMEKAAERYAVDKTIDAVSSLEVHVEDLRAICVGFVNITPNQDDAFQLGLDLMERWNQKLYESFKQRQPDARVRVFGAPSLDRLSYNLTAVRDDDYSDCLAVLQTGSFDTYQRSTGSHTKAEVILATFWETVGERKTVIAAGTELTLVPIEVVTRDEPKASIDPKTLWQQAVNASGEISETKLDPSRREETMRWWVGAVAAMPSLVFADLEYPPTEAKGRTWSMLGKTIYFLLNPEDSIICRPCKESHLCWKAALECEGTSSYWKHSLIATAELEDVRAHLDSEDPVLQMSARLKIAEHERDAGYLIELLKSGDCQMQEAAAAALGRIGDPSAVSALKEALHSGYSNLTRAALEALTCIGDQAVPALLHYLQEDNPWRRKAAALALGKVGNAQALGPLREALKVSVPREVQDAFRLAIEQIERNKSR